MGDFLFRPIIAWPGKMIEARKRATFRSSYQSTINLLKRELEALGANSVVIQLALMPQDIRQDGLPRANAKPSHPGVILSFDSSHGALSYPTDRFDAWEDNLRAIALSLQALRAVDRYGVTRRGEQYRGWNQLPGPQAKQASMTPEEAKALLHKYGGETQAIMASHPDRGGSVEWFEKVQEARKILGLA